MPFFKKKKKKSRFTIAFYNLENLFDPERDYSILDGEFTPTGLKKWTKKRYRRKLAKLAQTIVNIGREDNPFPPILIGVAEVENKGVLLDLLATRPMNETPYGLVHFDSPDERGIDTGLIYHKKYFEVVDSEAVTLYIDDTKGNRDATRDILYVKGIFNGEPVHLFVNHWPSRRDGANDTKQKRISAANLIAKRVATLKEIEEDPNIILMGDFNDDPSSESVQLLVEQTGLFNPMLKLHQPFNRGTSIYNKNWHLFDQILISNSFFNFKKGTHSFDMAEIYDDNSLKEKEGKYKGTPHRTFVGKRYTGGYSDHFPVYAIFSDNI